MFREHGARRPLDAWRRAARGGRVAAGALLAGGLALACANQRERPVECIAPANPGGGWDLTCRAVGRVLGDLRLVPGIVRVTNLPGAGGGIAFGRAIARRRADGTVLIAASPATTLRLAQRQFGRFTEEDVRWIAALAMDYGIVAVNARSPHQTLGDLLSAWRADPASVVVAGGSAAGGQDHMKMLLLARAAGIDPRAVRYVPFDGGGEAVTALLGGFVQAVASDGTEVRGLVDGGDLRVLAVLAPERVEGALAAVPTAREQGYDVDWLVWRGFYAPPEIDAATEQSWVRALEAVADSPEWARVRAETGLAPFFAAGEPFRKLVMEQVRTYRELSRELGLIQ